MFFHSEQNFLIDLTVAHTPHCMFFSRGKLDVQFSQDISLKLRRHRLRSLSKCNLCKSPGLSKSAAPCKNNEYLLQQHKQRRSLLQFNSSANEFVFR